MKYARSNTIPAQVLVLLTCLASACGAAQSTSDAGATIGMDGASATDTPSVVSEVDAGSDVAMPSGPAAACIESPPVRGSGRQAVRFGVVLTYAGKPVVFGEPFPVGGGSLTLTNFRFFLSDFALVTASGVSVPVDLVNDAGTPSPYNVHLVNPENPAGMQFHLSAPPGDYVGANFLFGLNDACNSQQPSLTKPPLDTTSQLTWPPPLGFLFLRYAGTLSNPVAVDGPPAMLDMAAIPGYLFAPRVSAPGGFRIEGPGQPLVLAVAIDEIFRASRMPATVNEGIPALPDVSFGEGEKLRQNAGKVAIFSITSGK